MSEVEKMYENTIGKVCTHTTINPERCNKRRMTRCCGCDYYAYPPFTAEKQLELIKWWGKKNYTISIHFYENEWGIATEDYSGYFQNNLADALASIINTHWQDLTESEQEQIKKILEI